MTDRNADQLARAIEKEQLPLTPMGTSYPATREPEPTPEEIAIIREAARQIGGMPRLRVVVNRMLPAFD